MFYAIFVNLKNKLPLKYYSLNYKLKHFLVHNNWEYRNPNYRPDGY